MEYIVNTLSVISSYGFAIGCIYLFMDATIGRLKFLQLKFDFWGVSVKDALFLIVAIILASKLKIIRMYDSL